MNIVNHSSLSGIERYPEPPLLPLDQVPFIYGEARSIRLSDVQLLQVLSQLLTQQLGDILASSTVIEHTSLVCLGRKVVLASTGSKLIDPDDLLRGPVHDRNQRKWIRVEVGVVILLARISCEDEALEEATILICSIKSAIRPRLDDDFEPGWELELLDLVLEQRRLLAYLDERSELGAADQRQRLPCTAEKCRPYTVKLAWNSELMSW